jgi:peptidoglycan/LPS O-acetylase OafA/YrhL
MLLAIAVERWPRVSRRTSGVLLAAAVAIGAVAVPLYTVGPLSERGNGSSVVYAPVMALAFAFLVASMVLAPGPSRLGRALRSRAAVGVGVISYGVFLWHFPVIEALR